MLRWLYIRLLWAHPAEFRYRFCDGMLEAFDHAADGGARLWLVADGIVSVLRQWVLRPDYHQPWQTANAAGPVYEPITFQQIEPYQPRGIALANGGLLAVLLLIGVVDAINHGGGKVRSFLIGMHRPSQGLIKVDRSSLETEPLNTTVVNGRFNPDDPLRPFARSYFRIVRVLSVLDTDGNLSLKAAEIDRAPDVLRQLDTNHDGRLSAEECGFLPQGNVDAKSKKAAQYQREFMRDSPVLAALDLDGDGVISETEIAQSPNSLRTLDFDHDGTLSSYELLPHPVVSQAAAMMSRFDTYDNGMIAVQGLPNDDPDAASIRRLLTAADRDHDGLVTRGELIIELAARGGAHSGPEAPADSKPPLPHIP